MEGVARYLAVQVVEDAVERAIVGGLELLEQDAAADIVDADVLAVAAGEDGAAVGGVAEAVERLAPRRVLGRPNVLHPPPAGNVLPALDHASDRSGSEQDEKQEQRRQKQVSSAEEDQS